MSRILLLLGFCPVAWSALSANPDLPDTALRFKGVFDSGLPGTEPKNSLHLLLHPHFGDFSKRDHLRIPIGLRYGLTADWEVTGEVETYFSHGLGDVSLFEQKGLSQLHLGTKYRLRKRWLKEWDTSVGFDYTHPLGRPPPDVTDGFSHFSPYVMGARPLASLPQVRVFWRFGSDFTDYDGPGRRLKNQLGDDTVSVSGGLVWTRGSYHYTLETGWTTADGIGGPEGGNVFSLRPGIIWEIPPEYTFHARGQWMLGLGLRATHGPDGLDFGGSLKLRLNLDLKRLLRRP